MPGLRVTVNELAVVFKRLSLFCAIVAASCVLASPKCVENENEVDFKVSAMNLSYLLDVVLATHPTVDAGKVGLRAANRVVKFARCQHYPTLGVPYQRAFADDFDTNFQGDDDTTVFSLEQPLWTGGRLLSGMASARADVKISEASL